MSEKSDQNKRPLSEAQLAQRRAAGSRSKTMTEAAIRQRQEAAEHSTGPVTEEGKIASSRNAWKTGEYAAVSRHELWKELGIGVLLRPCKSTCSKYPCSMVEDGLTQPGGDCLDKQVYVEAFDAIMATLHSGEVQNMHGLLASQVANAVNLLQQVWDHVNEHGVMIEKPIIDKKGNVVTDKDGEPYTMMVRNPMMNDVPKLLDKMGINLPELMATPRAVQKAQDDEDAVGAVHELIGRLGRASGNGPVRRRTIDVTPEQVEDD